MQDALIVLRLKVGSFIWPSSYIKFIQYIDPYLHIQCNEWLSDKDMVNLRIQEYVNQKAFLHQLYQPVMSWISYALTNINVSYGYWTA